MKLLAPILLIFSIFYVFTVRAQLPIDNLKVAKPVVIDDDPGGELGTYTAWYSRLRDAGVKVQVKGLCKSACTLVLSLPKEQFCVEPTASLGFHLAWSTDMKGRLTLLPETTYAISRRFYPLPVQTWLKGQKLGIELIYLSADELVQMGAALPCS